MEKPAYFIEEGMRRFYNENGIKIKEEAFSKLYRVRYTEEREDKKENDSRKSR